MHLCNESAIASGKHLSTLGKDVEINNARLYDSLLEFYCCQLENPGLAIFQNDSHNGVLAGDKISK